MWHRAHSSQEAHKANGCSSLAPRQARGYKLYINTVVPNLRLSDVVASRELQSSLSSCSHATRVMVAFYEGYHPSPSRKSFQSFILLSMSLREQAENTATRPLVGPHGTVHSPRSVFLSNFRCHPVPTSSRRFLPPRSGPAQRCRSQ